MKNAEAIAQDAAVQLEGICHTKGYNRMIIEPILLGMIQARDAEHDVKLPELIEEEPVFTPEPTEA